MSRTLQSSSYLHLPSPGDACFILNFLTWLVGRGQIQVLILVLYWLGYRCSSHVANLIFIPSMIYAINTNAIALITSVNLSMAFGLPVLHTPSPKQKALILSCQVTRNYFCDFSERWGVGLVWLATTLPPPPSRHRGNMRTGWWKAAGHGRC